MLYGVSTLLFFSRRLTPALLDSLRDSGAEAIEIYAARHHFEYTDRGAVREIASWFAANPVQPSLHMPLFSVQDEAQWSRHAAPSLNLIDTSKSARIATMDEVKRALEAAEQIPFRSCVLHLGLKDDLWDTRALDDSITSIEHLKAFAGPLGLRLLLKNLNNEVATPEHLVDIVQQGHFDSVGFCLDIGHAHLAPSVPETRHAPARSAISVAFEVFGPRLAQVQLHDNVGSRDEHVWPGEGNVDWGEVRQHLKSAPPEVVGMLEPSHELGVDEVQAARRTAEALAFVKDLNEDGHNG